MMAPVVVAWVRLNHEKLLAFWNDALNWSPDQIAAFAKSLSKVQVKRNGKLTSAVENPITTKQPPTD